MMKVILAILMIISGGAALYLDSSGMPTYKILVASTTLLILVWFSAFGQKSRKYRTYIQLGFLACLLADLIPYYSNNFVWELSFYIIAKFLFAEAFRSAGTLNLNVKLLSILGAAGLALFIYLSHTLGEFLIPIALYFGMMIYMSWAGIGFHMSQKTKESRWAMNAVFIWFVCEMISAFERFMAGSIVLGLLVHITYWITLVCIAQVTYIELNESKNKFSLRSLKELRNKVPTNPASA